MARISWTNWRRFPDPRENEFLHAPFGPGVYELRRSDTKQPILVGMGRNCAYRMSSLLPNPLGAGTRNNSRKREYVVSNLDAIQYRCCACETESQARDLEREMKGSVGYIYRT